MRKFLSAMAFVLSIYNPVAQATGIPVIDVTELSAPWAIAKLETLGIQDAHIVFAVQPVAIRFCREGSMTQEAWDFASGASFTVAEQNSEACRPGVMYSRGRQLFALVALASAGFVLITIFWCRGRRRRSEEKDPL